MHRPPDKRKADLAGNRGGLKIDRCAAKSDEPDNSLVGPFHQGKTALISVREACDRSGETPATIISWCVRHGIGGHVKTGRSGDWLVGPDALDQHLAERAAAA